MVDSAGESELPFQVIGNVGLDLLGRHSRVKRSHGNDWQTDRREHIHRHVGDADRAEDHDDQAQNNDQVRIAYGESRHATGSSSLVVLVVDGVRFVPGSFGVYALAIGKTGMASDDYLVSALEPGENFNSRWRL